MPEHIRHKFADLATAFAVRDFDLIMQFNNDAELFAYVEQESARRDSSDISEMEMLSRMRGLDPADFDFSQSMWYIKSSNVVAYLVPYVEDTWYLSFTYLDISDGISTIIDSTLIYGGGEVNQEQLIYDVQLPEFTGTLQVVGYHTDGSLWYRWLMNLRNSLPHGTFMHEDFTANGENDPIIVVEYADGVNVVTGAREQFDYPAYYSAFRILWTFFDQYLENR